MLVTLGSGVSLAAGDEDAGTDALDGFITIQIGNDVVCNDISFHGVSLLNEITGGGLYSTSDAIFKVDLGSHVLDGEENLYVTLRNGDASNAMGAIDVSATVNEGGVYQPLKYTNYADSVFTDTNTLAVYAWSDADLSEQTDAFTVRNQSYSSAPQIASGCTVSAASSYKAHSGSSAWKYIASMAQNQVPMNTSINYSNAVIDGVICISAMDKQPTKARQSAQAGRAVIGAMTSTERKAL